MTTEPLVPDVPVKMESMRRRYAATLFTQMVQFASSVLTLGMVPRALGPAAFGNYNFLLTTASTLRSFLDPSTSQAFFTFSSQDRRTGALTRLYALVLLAQLIIVLAFAGLMFAAGINGWLWPGQAIDQLILVTVLEWAVFVTTALRQLGDSKALTVRTQLITLVTALVNVGGLLALNASGKLNFHSYAWLNLFTALLVGFGLVHWLMVVNRDVTWAGDLRGRAAEYARRWWRYASPLILLEYYKPLAAYLGVYLLQSWYGSVEQGHFALAAKWSTLVLVFTNSALMIFWREIASATAQGDGKRAAALYLRFTNLLFFISLVLCTWLSFSSPLLVRILAGEQFIPAIPILAWMAFYPLQQTYGQINVAALKGAEKTRLVRNLGILISIPDLLLTYFLLASPYAPLPGLNLGGLGVAIRMVGYGLLSVQVYEWFGHHTFGLNYFRTLCRKLGGSAIILLCAALTLVALDRFLSETDMIAILVLGICSIAYFALAGTVFLLWPDLLGFDRLELLGNLNQARDSLVNSLRRK